MRVASTCTCSRARAAAPAAAGPLVVGLLLSAVAVGAAFSAGALAFTTLLLPLLVLMGVGGFLSFGLMGALGAALIIPQAIFSAASLVRRGRTRARIHGGVLAAACACSARPCEH